MKGALVKIFLAAPLLAGVLMSAPAAVPVGDRNLNVLPIFVPRIMRAVAGMIKEKTIFVITLGVRDGGIIALVMMIVLPALHLRAITMMATCGGLQQTVR